MGIGRDQEIAPTEEGWFLSNKSRDREIAPTEEIRVAIGRSLLQSVGGRGMWRWGIYACGRLQRANLVRKIDHKLRVCGTADHCLKRDLQDER